MRRSLLVFLLTAAAAALVIPWHGFIDMDPYYHAKMAELILAHGPVLRFPWLDLTLLGHDFADLHFLFHVLLVPFVAAFGALNGLRIATVLLTAACLTVFEYCVRSLKLPWPWLWTIVLFGIPAFATRLLLGKASALAILWFVAGLTLALKRKPWLVLAATFLFALSHGGWMFLSCSLVAFFCGDVMFRLFVERQETVDERRQPLRSRSATVYRLLSTVSPWRETLASFVGGLLGLVIHPNFPQTFEFSWVQAVVIGLGTPIQHVILGSEWLPAAPSWMLATFAIPLCLAVLSVAALVLAPKKPLDLPAARRVFALTLVAGALFVLTLKSRRNAEYFAPAFVLWVACLWPLIDAPRAWREVLTVFSGVGKRASRWVPWIIVGCLVVVQARLVVGLVQSFHPYAEADNLFADSMHAIEAHATPGERVFNVDWDAFPALFYQDDRLTYVYGVDPTFLYVQNPALSDGMHDLLAHGSSTTPSELYQLVHDDTSSTFVLAWKRPLDAPVISILQHDPRYLEIADTTDSVAFLVK